MKRDIAATSLMSTVMACGIGSIVGLLRVCQAEDSLPSIASAENPFSPWVL